MLDGITLTVEGSAKDRGLAIGSALRSAIEAYIRSLFGRWRQCGIEQPEAYAHAFMEAVNFDAAITRWGPDLIAEIEGIASGAGIPFEWAFAIQLLDEEWAYRKSVGIPAPVHKCSVAAIHVAELGTWIGQNMDLASYTDGFQRLILHREAEQPNQLVFTLAGLIGLMGVNSSGLAVCVNSIPQRSARLTGLPVAFVIRRLLQCDTVAEAVDQLCLIDHATSQHYLIADRHGIASLEASPEGVARVAPFCEGRYFHTNHPLAGGYVVDAGTWKDQNSQARLSTLQSRLGQTIPSIEALADALSSQDDPDHPICQTSGKSLGKTDFTTGSLISMLPVEGDVSGLWSAGPPKREGWRPWSLAQGR